MPVEVTEIELKSRALILAGELTHFVFHAIAEGSILEKVGAALILLAFFCISIYLAFKATISFLEVCIKLGEKYQSGPLAVIFNAEKIRMVRRRKQFCAVLDSDIAYMAKAENWNDQYFTDLEAEVETEGGYYLTSLRRLLKKSSSGLRRVSSLIRAIESSAERTVLLVGDPGSGKSVALRHLAKQLAEKGKKSNSQKTIIPLYLNLRELDADFESEINSDFIKQFVLENIRRGDADTSAYVLDNWNENKEKGLWFFLFDSFDEIPAILHAATGSEAIKKYSHAIRQFLEGMGNCRGVLASREYKGPEALPWKKFRILPLGNDRQNRLVDNSFLDANLISQVKHHLASGRSRLGNNPLFLSLLCRFVKDERRQPLNDHQLLTSHLRRLAERESGYVLRKYNLTAQELLDGGEAVAILFATNIRFSLAPKVDEIIESLMESGYSRDFLERLLFALVDVKIGRNDVSTARLGDRRFAFAHRRYQETIFANHLAANPGLIRPLELLTDPQWREYAVTLLQTQTITAIRPIVDSAVCLLNHVGETQFCQMKVGEGIFGYFSWTGEPFVSALEILQEGFVRRLEDVPEDLSSAISRVLTPRWDTGDYLDRYHVIRVGGLLPQTELVYCLTDAFSDSKTLISAAFKQCVFVLTPTEKLDHRIRRHLADEALCAHTQARILELEAITADLSYSNGASVVASRCIKIRPIFAFLSKANWLVFFPILIFRRFAIWSRVPGPLVNAFTKMAPKSVYKGGSEWTSAFLLVFIVPISLLAITVGHEYIKASPYRFSRLVASTLVQPYAYISAVVCLLLFFVLSLIYTNRDSETRIGLTAIRKIRLTKADLILPFSVIIALAILTFVIWIVGTAGSSILTWIGILTSSKSRVLEVGVLGTCAIFLGISGIAFYAAYAQSRFMRQKLEYLKTQRRDEIEILFHADSFNEAEFWITHPTGFMKDAQDQRLITAFLLNCTPDIALPNDFPFFAFLFKDFSQLRLLDLIGENMLNAISDID